MAKAHRSVKFQHRGSQSSGAEGRRDSFSDVSEAASEKGSHTGNGRDTKAAEVCCYLSVYHYRYQRGSTSSADIRMTIGCSKLKLGL